MPARSRSVVTRRWATGPEVADYIHVSLRTVREMAAQGAITGYRFGPRLIRYDLNEVDAAMVPSGGLQ